MDLLQFGLALTALLISAHVFGRLFVQLRLPRVVGEICGGLVLGPTGLGVLAPAWHGWLFDAPGAGSGLLSGAAWLGLVMLMFLAGLEVEKRISDNDRRMVVALLVGATALPCLAGWLAPIVFDFSPYAGPESHPLALRIILAIAVAVTSIPVISKIFLDLKIADTRFAKIVLTTATIQDVLLWTGLAVATGIVGRQSFGPAQMAVSVLVTIGFFIAALVLMPTLLQRITRSRLGAIVSWSPLGYSFSVTFLLVTLAGILQVNTVFAALLAGVLVGTTSRNAIQRPVRDVAMTGFVPIYFAVVGLNLDLINHFDLAFFFGFLVLTSLCEIGSSLLILKSVGNDWLSSFNLGMAMNARGGPGIVLATIAFETGIINQTFFSVLVLTAIVTSLVTGFWLRLVLAANRPLLTEGIKPLVATPVVETGR